MAWTALRRRSVIRLAAAAAVLCTVAVSGPAAAPAAAATSTSCGVPGQPVQSLSPLPDGTGEMSGLAASQTYPGWGWGIRDSGNPASLYAISVLPNGQNVVREIPVVGAQNHDWEDIVYEPVPGGPAHLWVIESGQSGGDRYLNEVEEPDPAHATTARLIARYTYSYPDVQSNTESALWDQGRLVLMSKTNPTKVYRFVTPLSTATDNVPELLGELPASQFISVARLSPDGRTLILADHVKYWVYEATVPGLDAMIGQNPVRVTPIAAGDNVEAGDWFPSDQCDFVMMAESRDVYSVAPTGLSGTTVDPPAVSSPAADPPTVSSPAPDLPADPPADVPEVPLPVLLPLSGAGIVVVAVRRARRSTPEGPRPEPTASGPDPR